MFYELLVGWDIDLFWDLVNLLVIGLEVTESLEIGESVDQMPDKVFVVGDEHCGAEIPQ